MTNYNFFENDMAFNFYMVTLSYEQPLSKTLKSASCVSEQYKHYQHYDHDLYFNIKHNADIIKQNIL